MKYKKIVGLAILILLIFMCTGCSSGVAMPYSSDDYVNGEWTVDELVSHFEELGFSEVEVCGNTTTIIGVYAEDDDSKYDSFEKDEEISTSRKIGIYTEFEIPDPISVDTSTEFAEFVANGIESDEDREAWQEFLESHDGEILEFDGTITDWYDDLFWTSISFTIAIEDSENMSFSKSTIELIDLGMNGEYHYNKYHKGLITEGMRVHVITEITEMEDGWGLELNSMEVIE